MSFMSVQMARHHGALSAAEVNDTASTTRPSSTANFYVDSLDKNDNQGSGDFVINKGQALFNGFFNRIGVAEVLMDWGLPNVAAWWGNNTFTVLNVGTGLTIGPVTIQDGFYTAIQVLTEACARINAAATTAGDPLRLTVTYNGLDVRATSTGAGTSAFVVVWDGVTPYALARQLFTSAQLTGVAASTGNTYITLSSPRVLGTTYVDIVSPQLTYNQELKDATTDNNTRDVLYRWYFAQDNVPQEREPFIYTYAATAAPAIQALTPTNIPVLQGYNAFVLRRALPYPKQIRWNPSQPIGQVTFQVYDDRGRIISTANFPWSATTGEGGANFQFQMSMLLSEN
jgi:hypothetical protein